MLKSKGIGRFIPKSRSKGTVFLL